MVKKTDDTEMPVASDGDLGRLLKAYRESKGYNSEQVADALCLSRSTIENLEAEAFEKLSGAAYIRGYLRNYAKLAGKDDNELIATYEALQKDKAEPTHDYKPAMETQIHASSGNGKLSRLLFYGIVIAALIGLFSLPAVKSWIQQTWQSFSQQTALQRSASTDNGAILTGNMPIPLPATPETTSTTTDTTNHRQSPDNTITPFDTRPEAVNSTDNTNHTDDNSQNTEPVSPNPLPALQNDETLFNTEQAINTTTDTDTINDLNTTNNENINTPEDNDEPSDNQPENTAADTSIKLVFNKEIWMRIKDKNDNTVFESLNNAGNEKTLSLSKPLTFRVGNADGLELYINGQAYDFSSSIKGSVANFVIE